MNAFANGGALDHAGGMAEWMPSSWRERPAAQQPQWPDEAALERALKQLAALPPLVFAGEARNLTKALGEVATGRAFLLQAGDCARMASRTLCRAGTVAFRAAAAQATAVHRINRQTGLVIMGGNVMGVRLA